MYMAKFCVYNCRHGEQKGQIFLCVIQISDAYVSIGLKYVSDMNILVFRRQICANFQFFIMSVYKCLHEPDLFPMLNTTQSLVYCR